MTAATKTIKKDVQQILTEDVLSLTEARAEIASITGTRPSKPTLTRWCHRGVRGIKLGHIRLGSQIFVSRQSLTRFIEARTAAGI